MPRIRIEVPDPPGVASIPLGLRTHIGEPHEVEPGITSRTRRSPRCRVLGPAPSSQYLLCRGQICTTLTA